MRRWYSLSSPVCSAGIEEEPCLMLQFIDAVEHDSHEIRDFLGNEIFRNPEPLFLARKVISDPVFAVFIGNDLERLFFLIKIPCQFPGVESRHRLEPVVKIVGFRIAAQMPPGNESRAP